MDPVQVYGEYQIPPNVTEKTGNILTKEQRDEMPEKIVQLYGVKCRALYAKYATCLCHHLQELEPLSEDEDLDVFLNNLRNEIGYMNSGSRRVLFIVQKSTWDKDNEEANMSDSYLKKLLNSILDAGKNVWVTDSWRHYKDKTCFACENLTDDPFCKPCVDYGVVDTLIKNRWINPNPYN